MKRSRPVLRRVLAIVAGAAIGLVGAVALASPASAHHSEVKGAPYCDTATGEWVVTWTVDSFAPRSAPTFKLIDVQFSPAESTLSGIAVTQGPEFPHQTGTPLVGEQRLAGDATSASLGVRAKWSNGFQESELNWGEVTFEGTCETPQEPGPIQVNDASTCDELTVTVTNPDDGETATVVVTPSEGDAAEATLEPGQSETFTFPAAEGLSYQATVEGTEIATGTWQDPGDCTVEIPVASLSDCDSLTVEVTNPLEDESIEATVTSGDVTETLTIAPGETGEATFAAEEGTVATVTIGEESLEIPWEEPEDCDGEGGGLPVTGSSTGLVAGAALALLILGAGLFLVARRRRITFTTS